MFVRFGQRHARSKHGSTHTLGAKVISKRYYCRRIKFLEINVCTVVIDKISDTYTQECTVKARVETRHTLSLDDVTDSIIGRRSSALGFNLCTGRERDERIAKRPSGIAINEARKRMACVSVVEIRPPPAPARACAVLLLCWEANVI